LPLCHAQKSCSEDPGEVHEKKSALHGPHHQAVGLGGGLPYGAVHQLSYTEAPEDSKQDCGPKTSPYKKMKEKGLAFVTNYWNRTEDDWSKVIFSDESTFCCLRATRSCARRPTRLDYIDTLYPLIYFFPPKKI
jgi:hypothetical protein